MKKTPCRRESAASGTLMTLQEVADYPRVTRATIHRMLKRNQIPTFRIGRHWRFNLEEIDNWCASQGAEALTLRSGCRKGTRADIGRLKGYIQHGCETRKPKEERHGLPVSSDPKPHPV